MILIYFFCLKISLQQLCCDAAVWPLAVAVVEYVQPQLAT